MKNDYIGIMSEAMTNEKALQGFEEFCETCRKNCEEAGAELVCNCCKVKRAKEALEKQIPKKVIEGKCFCEYQCACCGFVFDGTMPFCLCCGQALDWSE